MSLRPATLRAALLALPAILAAQDAAPAPTIAQRLKAGEAEITKLMEAMDGRAALAKAEALVPAAKPAFVKTNPRTGLESSQEYNSLMGVYSLCAKTALAAGEWEKAKGFLEKAQEVAKENQTETATVIAPLIETWNKAMEGSKKALEDGAELRKTLEAKTDRTPAEEQELNNFKIHDNNMKNGPRAIAGLQSSLDGLKSDAAAFEAPIASVDKKIKIEAEEMMKFKGDKAAYVKALLNTPSNLAGIAKPADKAAWLNRLLVLAPANATAAKKLALVKEGKPTDEPAKKAPKAKPAKKKA
jgi:hypothetical protein